MRLKQLLIIISFIFVHLTVSSQTLQRGRELFQKEDYSAAKPIMLKYLKQKPEDASRNFWYGVCCLKTGESEKALPYLEKAAAKKIVKAYRYIGDYYLIEESYPSVIENYDIYVEGLKADKELFDEKLINEYSHKSDSLRSLLRMIRNTQKVCFIDSFVVKKSELLNSYFVDESVGSFYRNRDFFDDNYDGEVYLPEMASRIVFSRCGDDGKYRLFQRIKSFDSWIEESPLNGLENDGNSRYPFLMNDGITIYYASDGPGSFGGLDIFVSRFNSNTDKYLIPENMGMPFNSEANDYMYVIDEVNNLGWFATDRNQSEDNVCIYVFVPDESRPLYNYEEDDVEAIHRAARIVSIKESQTDLDLVRTARQKLALLVYSQNMENESGDFTFVIDDLTDYHKTDDFNSQESRDLFMKWTELKDKYSQNSALLDDLRDEYSKAGNNEKVQMSEQLLKLENDVLSMELQIKNMEMNIRNTEIKYLQR